LITCHVKYVIDPYQLSEFEAYAKAWLGIVERLGGTHHGYFLPSEGASNIAYCLFSFPSLADYESYRHIAMTDAESAALVASLVERSLSSVMSGPSCARCWPDTAHAGRRSMRRARPHGANCRN